LPSKPPVFAVLTVSIGQVESQDTTLISGRRRGMLPPVHYYVHGRNGAFILKDPMALGHESAGTVVSRRNFPTASFPSSSALG
jgi:hypothetical protein